MKHMMSILLAGIAATLIGCTQHTVEVKPIKVEPIHITVDVNLKIDRQLDDFFDFQEKPNKS